MKVCVVGVGSIAGRHIVNLKEVMGDNVAITVLRSGMGGDMNCIAAVDRICYDSSELEKKYDAVFVTNPTFLHYDTLLRFRDRSSFFFIEKPVFMTGKEDLTPFLGDGKTYYVACPLRYTKVIQYLKAKVDFSRVYSIRCISSSYLPDWRRGTDYRKHYSAHRDMGGGVSIDLIHEWDYLRFLVGNPEKVYTLMGRKSSLEIDSEDIAVYIAEYKDKILELHLDYFGRDTVRKIELLGEDGTITGDLAGQKIYFSRENKTIHLEEDRDEYQKRELQHFLDVMEGRAENGNSLEEACKTLRIGRGEV